MTWLTAAAVRIVGQRLVSTLPWRLIGIIAAVLALVGGGLLARGWHERQIATITRTADAAGYARARAEITRVQEQADYAARAHNGRIAAAGATLNQETSYGFTLANADLDRRAAAFRVHAESARHAAAAGARVGTGATAAAGRTDAAAPGTGLPQSELASSCALALPFEAEMKLRIEAERTGQMLDTLQAWEAGRLKIEDAAAAERAKAEQP